MTLVVTLLFFSSFFLNHFISYIAPTTIPPDVMQEKWKEQIKLDLHRTFPDNVQFRPDGCDKQLQLGRVLQAYSAHNPTVGYCQGMNYVAGLLLLVMNGVEEQTFWLFDAMVSLLPPNQ